MVKKVLVAIVVVLLLSSSGWWMYRKFSAEETPLYRFTAVERGDLESAVSATGILGAVTTVQVGTQVSGQIAAILVDFNDPVKKGQLLARIDPILQEQAVRDAQASLERSRAELERSQLEYERNRRLFEQKVLTEIEFNSAKYSYAVSQANVKSAEVSLERAKRNLEYTSIYSPIDGIVVERNVDVGQTVAASMSTPQLFLLAKDLGRMQILASVDESDIGQIKKDQPVRFTVQAYSDKNFEGNVEQVRLQSKTTENVVNYTVVVSVSNPAGQLLPGMTATLEFLTGKASDVLMVPNTALRFRPPEEVMAKIREDMQKARAAAEANGQTNGTGRGRNAMAGGPSETGGAQQGAAGQNSQGGANRGNGGNGGGQRQFGNGGGGMGMMGMGQGRGMGRRSNMGMLWYLDEKGELKGMRVRTGLTDGQKTEVSGRDLKEGQEVVIGVTQTQQKNSTAAPFQPSAPQGGGQRRPGGGFF